MLGVLTSWLDSLATACKGRSLMSGHNSDLMAGQEFFFVTFKGQNLHVLTFSKDVLRNKQAKKAKLWASWATFGPRAMPTFCPHEN